MPDEDNEMNTGPERGSGGSDGPSDDGRTDPGHIEPQAPALPPGAALQQEMDAYGRGPWQNVPDLQQEFRAAHDNEVRERQAPILPPGMVLRQEMEAYYPDQWEPNVPDIQQDFRNAHDGPAPDVQPQLARPQLNLDLTIGGDVEQVVHAEIDDAAREELRQQALTPEQRRLEAELRDFHRQGDLMREFNRASGIDRGR